MPVSSVSTNRGYGVGGQKRTPIERAIDAANGVPDRQARYVAKQNTNGLKRIAVWVPIERAEEFKRQAKDAVERHAGSSND